MTIQEVLDSAPGTAFDVDVDELQLNELAGSMLESQSGLPLRDPRISLGRARSGFRRRLVALRHRPDPAPAVPPAADDVLLRDDQRAVIDALRALPARQRECLVLRFYADLSESEIASTLEISPNSVKTHVRRGLAALEARLEERR